MEYIILTDTPELDLVESYTNEFNYIQEGKILDAAIGKDKQESMLTKILYFLPRLFYNAGKFILTKLANTKLGSKIGFLQRWCETPDNTNESYVVESRFDESNPWDAILYNKSVSIGSFKKINELSVTLVNLCNEMPEDVHKLVELSLIITDVMDRAYEDARRLGAVDMVEQEHRKDVKRRISSYIAKRKNLDGLDNNLRDEAVKRYIGDLKVKRFNPKQGQINPMQSGSMKIFGDYANPFDPKWEKYFYAVNVKPYDVQRECTKVEKIIGVHTIKVSKLYDEFNKVVPKIKKDNTKISKPTTVTINPNKKTIYEALKYINDTRRNMLYAAKQLEECSKRLEQMNPQRYKNVVMDVSYLIKHYRMMYNDCTKLSGVSRDIVNYLVDSIDYIIEATGNSEAVIQHRAGLRITDDREANLDRYNKLVSYHGDLSKKLQNTTDEDTKQKLIDKMLHLEKSIYKIGRRGLDDINDTRHFKYSNQIRHSKDPYNTNRLRDALD